MLEPDPEPPSWIPEDYEGWLRHFFPEHVTAGFADRHHRFWQWVWALELDVRPATVPVLLWPRGGAKSTSVELGCAAVGARDTRRYALYVSGSQTQADDHVGNVASLLESARLGAAYPTLGQRLVNKFGSSLGWRRNRVRTASGFTIDALGLDVAARGVKLDEQRPDLIVFDDVDDTADSMETIKKKIISITQKILPAESIDAGAIFVQNLVHYESIAARLAGLASEPADFLADRDVSGPYPAVIGLKTERIPGTIKYRVIGGTPTWAGQDLATCEQQINRWGLRSFKAEAQHDRIPPEGAAFPEFDQSVHVCDPFPIPESWAKIRAIDYGYAAPYCCLWIAQEPDGSLLVYQEDYGAGWTAPEQAQRILVRSDGERYRSSYGDPAMWANKREGKKFKSIADQYKSAGVPLQQATNDRLAGWERLHEYLRWEDDVPPSLRIFRTCTNLVRTLPMLPKDEHRPEDVDTNVEDHAPDTLRYGVMGFTRQALTGVLKRTVQAAPHVEPDIRRNLPTLSGRLLPEQRKRLNLTGRR